MASNRLCVIGGISCRDDSQETLSNDAADGAGTSPSTLGVVEKATNKRVGRSGGGEAGEPQTPICSISLFARFRGVHVFATAFAVILLNFNVGKGESMSLMRRICIEVAATVNIRIPQASLQVALHVTKRQNGAMASNRLCVIGGISCRDDSQETLSNDAADGAYYCWSEGDNASGVPKYVN
ncbi:hypothetical protein [Orrella marina]|uniref:hypothetical protein n=1 Tax=Orrella marina TaxID=2163011 RepID=UPI00131F307E|nr:hypothetical protein [Orrella marina]